MMRARFRRMLLGLAFAWVAALPLRAQPLEPVPALTSPVVDTTGTLDAAEIARLERQALALQQRKGSQLQVLMVPTTRPEPIEAYAQRVFDAWKLGRKGVDDGVLLVVAKDDRAVRIHPGYGLEGAIPDIAAGRVIQEYLVPKFRAGDFAGGIGDATAQLVRLIDGEPLPAPMAAGGDGGSGWVPGAFLALFASMFARSLLGGLPALPRVVALAVLAGGMLLLFSAPWLVVLIGAAVGATVGAIDAGGAFARRHRWGPLGDGVPGGGMPDGRGSSGGWGGGSGSGSGGFGGGWSGGGGRSGGGGASGSW